MMEEGLDKMIKLIVTDMDGCLLDRAGKLPPDFMEAYELMKEKNVLFAAASGRSLVGLQYPFGSLSDDMAFIADNGARIIHKGKILSEEVLKPEEYLPVVEEVHRHDKVLAVACGLNNIWVENSAFITDEAKAEMRKYYPEWHVCDFTRIPEKVVKIALLYFGDIEKDIYPYFKKFETGQIRVQVSAFVWIDVFSGNVSKGNAVHVIQQRLGILPEETAAFGDYLNDLSMADYAAYSFAPENAHPEVKRRFTQTIKSNAEYGVTGKIISLLK